MSYLKIVRQMSGLVTPDRSLARGEPRWGRGRSAPVMYTSQALTRDTLHPWHTFHHICHHRACWKPPWSPEQEGSAARRLRSVLCSGTLHAHGWGRRGCPTWGLAMPWFPAAGTAGCASRNAVWDLENRKFLPASPSHSELDRLP